MITGGSAILLVVLVLCPFLDSAERGGVLLAAAIALPVQFASFVMLIRYRGRLNGFLAAWVGGTLVRMVVIAATAFLVIRSETDAAVPTLLALAGFFLGLLLLEPLYFRADPSEAG